MKCPHLADKIEILNRVFALKSLEIQITEAVQGRAGSPMGIHSNVPPHGTRYAVAALGAATLEPLLPAAPALHCGGAGCASAGALTVRTCEAGAIVEERNSNLGILGEKPWEKYRETVLGIFFQCYWQFCCGMRSVMSISMLC